MKSNYIVLSFFGLLIVAAWAATVHNVTNTPIHDTQEITIPFVIKSKEGKTLLSDSFSAHVSDDPLMITKYLQNLLAKKFQAMSEAERMQFGGSNNYGLNSQRWTVYQGTKMFKMFSKEQALIDNYDRLEKKYHTLPLTATYLVTLELS